MKQELSFSEILEKQINKINKRHAEELKLIAEIKARQQAEQDDGLKNNQINIIDLIR